MNKKILFLILLGILILPVIALADDITITGMVANVEAIISYIAGAVVVILWITTGLLFLLAQGDPGKTNSAKAALYAAVIGTVIVVLAYSAMNIVNSAITAGQ